MADDTFSFGVYIPSYGRAKFGVITGKLFEKCTYVVRKEQEEEYKNAGFENLLVIDDPNVTEYASTFNWIVENTPEDVIAIVDDDVQSFVYRLEYNYAVVDKSVIQSEFERLAQLLYDLEIGLGFGTATETPYGYTSEFRWCGTCGAYKIVNKKCIKSKMDPELPRNTDIDYVLQELLKNRICLNALYFCDKAYVDKDTNVTGSAYLQSDIDASVSIMKNRWGKYFQYDKAKNVPKVMVER